MVPVNLFVEFERVDLAGAPLPECPLELFEFLDSSRVWASFKSSPTWLLCFFESFFMVRV